MRSPDFESFVNAQAAALRGVSDLDGVHTWQAAFAEQWSVDAASYAQQARQMWSLQRDEVIRPEPGWLCAQSGAENATQTWILLSVNPGISDVIRQTEVRAYGLDAAYKLCRDTYRGFFANYLDEMRAKVLAVHGYQHGAWWNHALVFLHECADLTKPPRTCQLHQELRVLGWEMWPFRSRRDGLTRAAQDSNLLRNFAQSSVQTALRLPADAIVVASAAGFDALKTEHRSLGLCQIETAKVADICVTHYRHGTCKTKPPVFALRRQLFSGFGVVSRERRSQLVAWIRARLGDATSQQGLLEASTTPIRPSRDDDANQVIDLTAGDKPGDCIYFTVSVGGNEQLGPFDESDDPHQRIAGYWPLGSGKRATAIQRALSAGQRVYLIGHLRGVVARVIEVSTEPVRPAEAVETLGKISFHIDSKDFALHRVRGDGPRWAVAYTYKTKSNITKIRYRIMTAEVDDAEWIGRRLAGQLRGGPISGPFSTTSLAAPERYEAATTPSAQDATPCP